MFSVSVSKAAAARGRNREKESHEHRGLKLFLTFMVLGGKGALKSSFSSAANLIYKVKCSSMRWNHVNIQIICRAAAAGSWRSLRFCLLLLFYSSWTGASSSMSSTPHIHHNQSGWQLNDYKRHLTPLRDVFFLH